MDVAQMLHKKHSETSQLHGCGNERQVDEPSTSVTSRLRSSRMFWLLLVAKAANMSKHLPYTGAVQKRCNYGLCNNGQVAS